MKYSLTFTAAALMAAPFVPCAQAQDETPLVIFISDNTPAKTAIEAQVVQEYNDSVRENLRVTDFAAWQAEMDKPSADRFADFIVTSFRSVPADFRNARFSEIQSALGLADDDPADKGFTDVLEAAGYNVRRSITTRISDPITGATEITQEFWGEGEAFSETGDYKLGEAQIADLSQADLIIFSNDITHNRYTSGGRIAGQPSTVLIEQWNSIPVPIISMDNLLMGTMEFGDWGFGWSYGFSITHNSAVAYDRRDIQGSDRFVFPDLRPVVRSNDPVFLNGLSPVDDNRMAIWSDLFTHTPSMQIKFSNNENYNYPATANVILEMAIPSFVVTAVGDIPVRNPILMEFPANVQAFNPTNGIPAIERVAVPAAPRLYFAAGARNTGLYNLSAAGESIFLNAVAKYTGGSVEPTPKWLGYDVDSLGWVDATDWLGSWVNVSQQPYIFSLALNKYLYITDDSGWIFAAQ